jgi:hypothetical protein
MCGPRQPLVAGSDRTFHERDGALTLRRVPTTFDAEAYLLRLGEELRLQLEAMPAEEHGQLCSIFVTRLGAAKEALVAAGLLPADRARELEKQLLQPCADRGLIGFVRVDAETRLSVRARKDDSSWDDLSSLEANPIERLLSRIRASVRRRSR